MTGEVHICSSQVVVGVQIEAMIYDMCCKQSLCISQGPVTAPAQAVKGSVMHSLILHLGHNPPAKIGFMFRRVLIQENKKINLKNWKRESTIPPRCFKNLLFFFFLSA